MELQDLKEHVVGCRKPTMRLLALHRELLEEVRDDLVKRRAATGTHHRICGGEEDEVTPELSYINDNQINSVQPIKDRIV